MLPRPIVALCLALAASVSGAAEPQLLPRPQSVELRDGTCVAPDGIIAVDCKTEEEFAKARRILTADGVLKNVVRDRQAGVRLSLRRQQEAGYRLAVDGGAIELAYGADDQLNAGLTTLRQLAWNAHYGWILPRCVITDAPRYAHRGFMLDESRHFSGKQAVLRLLDAMELVKLNVFHWHLTDSPGWRVEIKAYPRLTEVGAVGSHSDPAAPRAFYTQADVREVVEHARARGIEIIPEIDMPGHATAANRAYPEFSGGGSEKYPDFTFNPASERADAYLRAILAEVRGLFPYSRTIHLGGDEVHFGWEKWPELPEVKQLMAAEKLTKLEEVEGRFVRRYAEKLGRDWQQVGLWDEASRFDLPKEKTLLFWWRHNKPEGLRDAADKGYEIVLCPRIPLYFDFVQDPVHGTGRKWKGMLADIAAVHAFPESLGATLPANARVRGIQANLWTEQAVSQERRDFLTFPRLLAVAESAWTRPERKDFPRFQQAVNLTLPRLEALGIKPWKGGPEIAR